MPAPEDRRTACPERGGKGPGRRPRGPIHRAVLTDYDPKIDLTPGLIARAHTKRGDASLS